MRAPYPANRLHNQHPPPPESESRGQPNRAETGGSILDADSPLRGSKLHAETQKKPAGVASSALLTPFSLARKYKLLRLNEYVYFARGQESYGDSIVDK